MANIDLRKFEQQAFARDWRSAVTVLSQSTVNPITLEALMTPDAHREIRIALAARPDVTAEQLAWVADCDDPYLLNRAVSHPRTSKATIQAIRERAAGRKGDTWIHLRAFIDRKYGAPPTTLIR